MRLMDIFNVVDEDYTTMALCPNPKSRPQHWLVEITRKEVERYLDYEVSELWLDCEEEDGTPCLNIELKETIINYGGRLYV